jgi:hypothetical protein
MAGLDRCGKSRPHRDFVVVSTYTLFRKDSSTYKRSIETHMIPFWHELGTYIIKTNT